jgi:hypothetical protein
LGFLVLNMYHLATLVLRSLRVDLSLFEVLAGRIMAP